MLAKDDFNWVVINPSRKYFQVSIGAARPEDDVVSLATKPEDSVIRIVFGERDSTRQFSWFGMTNCVLYTKYALGIPVKGLTPWRLYKRLLNFRSSEYAKHGIISIELVKGVNHDRTCGEKCVGDR